MEHKFISQEEFAALPNNEKRIEIAKDVLKWLALGKIDAKRKTYLQLYVTSPYDEIEGFDQNANKELRDVMSNPDIKCSVCGIGALFMADIMKRDNFKARKLNSTGGLGAREIVVDKLDDYFTQDQLVLIETAFEGTYLHSGRGNMTLDELIDVGNWLNSTVSRHDRLEIIMNNIIRNKGELIIPVEETINA